VVTNCSLDSPSTAVASILVVCHSTSPIKNKNCYKEKVEW
jgi:hypothetical protein